MRLLHPRLFWRADTSVSGCSLSLLTLPSRFAPLHEVTYQSWCSPYSGVAVLGGKQGRALRTPAFPREPISASKPRSSSKVHTPQAPDTSEPTNSLSASLSLSLSLSVCPLRSCLGSRWSVKTKQVVGGVQDATFPCVISVLGPIGGELFPTISQQALFLVCLFVCFFTQHAFCTRTRAPLHSLNQMP